ncbi:MAG: hypothetical protein II348_01825 [Clostridia bacterium]|nr:hypothetical protein [Clostridia bacterium]
MEKQMILQQLKDELYQKTNGFIKGICHPNGESTRILDAGITWVRMDAPFPFDENGAISESHNNFVKQIRDYYEIGLHAILISPYPGTFIENGIDPRTIEGLEEVRRICAFMAKEYEPFGVCWQATNEMHIVHFRAPLNAHESTEFLIASLQGLRQGASGAAIGHNSVSHDGTWNPYCLKINDKVEYDYIGLDLYNGTWSDGGPKTYVEQIEALYQLVQKPVILMEFGFSSRGGNIRRGGSEITEYLRRLGYRDETELFSDPLRFVENLPKRLQRSVMQCAPEDFETAILNCFPHLLKSWISEPIFPHDESGQAQFYESLLPMLLQTPCLAGAVLYCWRDSDACFSCGAHDCPCETAWGITRMDGSKKPVYRVIQKIYMEN